MFHCELQFYMQIGQTLILYLNFVSLALSVSKMVCELNPLWAFMMIVNVAVVKMRLSIATTTLSLANIDYPSGIFPLSRREQPMTGLVATLPKLILHFNHSLATTRGETIATASTISPL